MRTSRRILLTLVCIVTAFATLFVWSLLGLIGPHGGRLGQLLQNSAEVFPVYFVFALPSWLIALPFVILLKDAEGWRGWATLVIGVLIGPGFILLWGLVESPGHLTWQGDSFALVASAIISLLTTVCYVLTLKFAHGRSIASGQ